MSLYHTENGDSCYFKDNNFKRDRTSCNINTLLNTLLRIIRGSSTRVPLLFSNTQAIQIRQLITKYSYLLILLSNTHAIQIRQSIIKYPYTLTLFGNTHAI